jgi:hypothetical protein
MIEQILIEMLVRRVMMLLPNLMILLRLQIKHMMLLLQTLIVMFGVSMMLL